MTVGVRVHNSMILIWTVGENEWSASRPGGFFAPGVGGGGEILVSDFRSFHSVGV